jgi:hypothetical protein
LALSENQDDSTVDRGREDIGLVCGGQRTKEVEREGVCMGCRHVEGDKKRKDNRRRLENEGKLSINGCEETVQLHE